MTSRFVSQTVHYVEEGGEMIPIYTPTNKEIIDHNNVVENWWLGLTLVICACLITAAFAFAGVHDQVVSIAVATNIAITSVIVGVVLIAVMIPLGRYRKKIEPCYWQVRRAEMDKKYSEISRS